MLVAHLVRADAVLRAVGRVHIGGRDAEGGAPRLEPKDAQGALLVRPVRGAH